MGQRLRGRRGVNFNYRYYAIYQENVNSGMPVCRIKRYPPIRNCYTSAPRDIPYRLPDVAVRRMRTSLTTTFPWAEVALYMFLAYLSLVAAGVRLPGHIHLFAGTGVERKTLLLCDLMVSVWGSGHAAAPLQTPGGFRKKGHLYREMMRVSVNESKHTHSGSKTTSVRYSAPVGRLSSGKP